MKSFIDKMNEFSFTENNALAYKSSGKKLTDFNFKISYYRNNPDKALNDFIDLVNTCDNMETIARYVFYLGDIRQGLGERQLFRICLNYFLSCIGDEKQITQLFENIPEYNRWDSIWKISLNENSLSIIRNQLTLDIYNQVHNKPISLLAKWLPSENASSEKTKSMAKIIRNGLDLTPKEYRTILSRLRKHLDIVERKMSSNHWNEINYEKVPSKANLIYSNSFFSHDQERRLKYLENLKKGKVKINSSIVYPYEIIDKYYNIYREKPKYDEFYEQMWKSLPKLELKNTLVVRDGSGSMLSRIANTSCLSVSTALAIYMAENNSDRWKDKFITFSHCPEVVDLSRCNSLIEKLVETYSHDDFTNTDIYKTMMLVLNTATKNNMKQDELPETILIISDMQFDETDFHIDGVLFDEIKEKFNLYGYKLPKICFWNVSGHTANTVPMQENEYGLILCSGFSINIMKMFLSGKTDPYEVLMDVLYSKRYDAIGNIFKK